MTEPIVITFNLAKIALFTYGISKIAFAIYLQRCYLKAAEINIQNYGDVMTPSKMDTWGNFLVNLLLAFEVTILRAMFYPLKLLVTGSNENFLEFILPEEYKDSKSKCNCGSNIDGRLPCPEHEPNCFRN